MIFLTVLALTLQLVSPYLICKRSSDNRVDAQICSPILSWPHDFT